MPSDEKALEARAGVYRFEKKYAAALSDYKKVGLKLQLYATKSARAGDARWEQGDLLAVSKTLNNKDEVKLVVVEVNNLPLEKEIIVPTRLVGWSGVAPKT